MLDRLNSAGVTSAQDIVVYLDAQEPGSDNRITLNNLTLNVYGQSGDNSQKFTASYEGLPLNPTVCPGQGNNCVTSTTRRQGYCSQFLAPRSRGVNGELLRRHRRSRPTVPYRMPKWRVRGRCEAPPLGRGLVVLLAIGGLLFGGKVPERLKKRTLRVG